MKWNHLNKIRASMSYIEDLVIEIETSLECKNKNYKKIINDLNEDETKKVIILCTNIKQNLKKIKEKFNLEVHEMKISQIVNTNSSFIWETIDDLWSDKLEKTSGKISSQSKKEELDLLLKEIYENTSLLKKITYSKNENS